MSQHQNIEKNNHSIDKVPQNTQEMMRQIYTSSAEAVKEITDALNTVSGIEKSHELAVRSQAMEAQERTNELKETVAAIEHWMAYNYA